MTTSMPIDHTNTHHGNENCHSGRSEIINESGHTGQETVLETPTSSTRIDNAAPPAPTPAATCNNSSIATTFTLPSHENFFSEQNSARRCIAASAAFSAIPGNPVDYDAGDLKNNSEEKAKDERTSLNYHQDTHPAVQYHIHDSNSSRGTEARELFPDSLIFNAGASLSLSPGPSSSSAAFQGMPHLASVNYSPSVGIGNDFYILPSSSILDAVGIFNHNHMSPVANTFYAHDVGTSSAIYPSPSIHIGMDENMHQGGNALPNYFPTFSATSMSMPNLPTPPQLSLPMVTNAAATATPTTTSQNNPSFKRSIGKTLESLTLSKKKKKIKQSQRVPKRSLPIRKRSPVLMTKLLSSNNSPVEVAPPIPPIPIAVAYLPTTFKRKKKNKMKMPVEGSKRRIQYYEQQGKKITMKTLENSSSINVSTRGCKCKNSKCVKLYCECFQGGNLCQDGKCICTDCKNTLVESREGGIRYLKIQELLGKRPDAFDVRELKTDEGCRCKKSNCLKKYCACYREGNKCEGDKCRCTDCKNVDLQENEDSSDASEAVEEESADECSEDETEEMDIEYNHEVSIAYPSPTGAYSTQVVTVGV